MSVLTLKGHAQSFAELASIIARHRQLTWEMAKRDITDRYAGQILGALWTIGHPLALMGVYIFIFAVVFKMKIGGTYELPFDYTCYLLSALIPWMAFQESMSKASTVIVGNSNLVKQVVFPLEVLPIKGAIASMIPQLVATAILIVYVIGRFGSLPWTYALLPLIWVFQFLAMVGIGLLLASIGTYLRDVKDFIQVFCIAGMYFMPIFYLPEWVPELIKPLLYLNPFSYLAWCYQDVCYFGRIEHPWAWPVFALASLLVLGVGYRCFSRLKVCFGSVL